MEKRKFIGGFHEEGGIRLAYGLRSDVEKQVREKKLSGNGGGSRGPGALDEPKKKNPNQEKKNNVPGKEKKESQA